MSTLAAVETAGVATLPAIVLVHGGVLVDGRIAWRRHGSADRPAVLVLGGISAHRDVAAQDDGEGWWSDVVGAGRAVDTDAFNVIGIDWLGGSGASTQASELPRLHGDIPAITPADQAAAIVALLDVLGIDALHACVGSSYGGMVALALAARFAERVNRLVVLCAAHEPHPMATALRSLQRAVVRDGIAKGDGAHALHIARGIAMTTYRSAREFAARFDTRPRDDADGFRFAVEDYLAHHGRAFAQRFTPDAFLCLSQSIDLHRIEPADVRVPSTLIAFEPDAVTPAWQVRELARQLGARWTLRVLPSIYGHDAFLKEVEAVSRIVKDALCTEVAP